MKDDMISRQAAIDALHMHLMYRMGTDSNKKRLDDWINGLPSAQETHEERTETHACDSISRQAAIEVAKQHWYKPDIAGALAELPSVQPDNSCDGCRYENADDGVLVPCGFCKRSYSDNYERRTDE